MTKIKILLGFSACFAVINLVHLAMQVIYLGFGILTISQIIKNGILLKQENELTI